MLDFGSELNISEVLYTARAQDLSGGVKDYEIYLSADGRDWGQAAAKGTLAAEPLQQTIRLTQASRARYLKFVVLSEQTSDNGAAIAELDIR